MRTWPDGVPFEPSVWPIDAARAAAWRSETIVMRDPREAYLDGLIDASELARRLWSGRNVTAIRSRRDPNRT